MVVVPRTPFARAAAVLVVLVASLVAPIAPRAAATPTPASSAGVTAPATVAAGRISLFDGAGCALDDSAHMWCWGNNQFGGLNTGAVTPMVTSPQQVTLPAPGTATAVSVGEGFACALLTSASVWCWGNSAAGRLGNGGINGGPVLLPSPGTAVAIAAGSDFACAVLTSGQVTCWGDGAHGQLGNGGTSPNVVIPTPALALPDGRSAIGITAGMLHTCALLDDHTVACWGNDNWGQLGNGASGTDVLTPQRITLPSPGTASAVAAGDVATCAVLTSGRVTCWGDNSRGQQGTGVLGGTRSTPAAPVSLPGGATATGIAVGTSVCAVLAGGGLSCWGAGTDGEVGDGSRTDVASPTVPATSLTGVTAVATSYSATCVTTTDGTFRCWGRDWRGQLGNGADTSEDLAVPTHVPMGVLGWGTLDVTAGDTHSCALDGDGLVRCWGDDTFGQLGNGAFTAPVTSPPSTPVNLPGVGRAKAVSAGGSHTCALLVDGTVACWGRDESGEVGDNVAEVDVATAKLVTLPSPGRAASVVAGGNHTCAILTDGNVTCWGDNTYGELGNANANGGADVRVPTGTITLPGSGRAIAIALAFGVTCAVLAGGDVTCWGNDSSGQLGNGLAPAQSSPPAPVSLPSPGFATAVAVSSTHVCALLADGHVTCWGANGNGQLGNGVANGVLEPSPPAVIAMPSALSARALSVGTGHSCAVLVDGTDACWGRDVYGEAGVGAAPLPAPNLTVATRTTGLYTTFGFANEGLDISVGLDHVCGQQADGSFTCWGRDQVGQLGNGNLSSLPVPGPQTPIVLHLAGHGIRKIAAGTSDTCVLRTSGEVWCAGTADQGQLGLPLGTADTPTLQPLAYADYAIDVAVGDGFACALQGTGAVVCWGSNAFGTLGTGSTAPVHVGQGATVTLPASAHAIALAAGSRHVCALMAGGSVVCWGDDSAGQLGDDHPNTISRVPTGALALPSPGIAIGVSAGNYHTCATLVTGAVTCWGTDLSGVLGNGAGGSSAHPPATVTLPGGRLAIGAPAGASASGTQCQLLADRTVACWGSSSTGQAGTGTTGSVQSPTLTTAVPDGQAQAVANGRYHMCVLGSAGGVSCAGTDAFGQLGDGLALYFGAALHAVPALAPVRSIAAGLDHTCVVTGDGEPWCWGANDRGQDGTGTVGSTPVPPSMGHNLGGNAITPAPGPAVLGEVTPSTTSVHVTFALMTDAVIDTLVTVEPGHHTATVTGTEATIDGLTPGTAYTVSVAPRHAFGRAAPVTAGFTTLSLPVIDPSTFVPLVPARLLDTRPDGTTVDGLFRAGGVLAAGSTLALQVTGRAGVPADAAAVALNVAVTEPAAAGFITVFPCGATRPNAANLNHLAGQTIPNAVLAGIGTDGQVCLFTLAATHLVVDVDGYALNRAGTPAAYTPVVPARLLDTRPDGVTVDGAFQAAGPVGTGHVLELQVAGRAGVPGDATAVALNVTATQATGPGFITAFPCGTDRPTAASLNYVAGQTIPNLVLTKVGAGGKVCLFAYAGTHLVADVNGFVPAGAPFTASVPSRLLDTRPGQPTADGRFAGGGAVPAGTTLALDVSGRVAIPANASTAVLNVTVTNPGRAGYITAFPCGSARPTAANLNYVAGQTIPNAVNVSLGADGKVCLFTLADTDLVVDVNGWFTG